jgi:glyoxylase-like metal-dependent hydrolase (beta-lactamase superfamily II)
LWRSESFSTQSLGKDKLTKIPGLSKRYTVEQVWGDILIDAPIGSSDWVSDMAVRLDLLLITHGQIDHIGDAAKMKRRFRLHIIEMEFPSSLTRSFSKILGFFWKQNLFILIF